jgi:hypothetical protein
METTFVKATGRAANLKAIISDTASIRLQVSEAVKVYEHGLMRNSRGNRLANMLDPLDPHFDMESQSRWSALTADERHLLHNYLSWAYEDFTLGEWQASASMMDQISISGVRYARKGVLKRDQDSHILFIVPGTNDIGAGEILNIFRYWHTKSDGVDIIGIYLVINRFSPTEVSGSLGFPDPYRQYPAALGCLWLPTVLETRIIEAEHVRGHFALTLIEHNDQRLMHVLPLNRVSTYFAHLSSCFPHG